MGKCFHGVRPIVLFAIALSACNLASCRAGARKDGLPAPESEQLIGEALKDLYMAAAAAVPRSLEQQKLILRMAQEASNGKELLLVVRAASGVFPSGADSREQRVERQVRATMTAKIMELATLDQMIEYAAGDAVAPESARPFMERMFRLGDRNSDPRVWYRIKAVAFHLKAGDLERQAQSRADQLADRSHVAEP